MIFWISYNAALMAQSKFTGFRRMLSPVFVLLILSLPFYHLHPPVVHADSFSEHNHPAVVHTIFSMGNESRQPPPADALHAEDVVELSKTTIEWSLFSHRLSIESASVGSTVLWIVVAPFPLYAPEGTALQGDEPVFRFTHWIRTLPPARAPPQRLFS